MHVNNHRGRKINFTEKCLICWGIEVKLIKFQGFKGQTLRQKPFRKLRIFFVFGEIWGDQCIIFGEKGSTDPPGASVLSCYIMKIQPILTSICKQSLSILNENRGSAKQREKKKCKNSK